MVLRIYARFGFALIPRDSIYIAFDWKFFQLFADATTALVEGIWVDAAAAMDAVNLWEREREAFIYAMRWNSRCCARDMDAVNDGKVIVGLLVLFLFFLGVVSLRRWIKSRLLFFFFFISSAINLIIIAKANLFFTFEINRWNLKVYRKTVRVYFIYLVLSVRESRLPSDARSKKRRLESLLTAAQLSAGVYYTRVPGVFIDQRLLYGS